MDEYICREDIIRQLCLTTACSYYGEVVRTIIEFPTADVQPVKYGYWEEITDYGGWGDTHYRCSVCGEEWHLEDGKPKDNNMNFCPRCGARMEMMNSAKL